MNFINYIDSILANIDLCNPEPDKTNYWLIGLDIKLEGKRRVMSIICTSQLLQS